MARIVLITHEYDRFTNRRGLFHRHNRYMFATAVPELRARGHTCIVLQGLGDRPQGDAALLHVDATVTPQDYVDYASSFPICVNLRATDISKRKISQAVVEPGGSWEGPVIVKSNYNHGGSPEQHLNRMARRSGRPMPFPEARRLKDYRVYDHSSEVPPEAFDDAALVVEQFLPEREKDGYAMRHWIFCGDGELCGRFVSRSPLVKGGDIFRFEPAEVPQDLRRRRQELGIDFGKFDFAVHDGKSYLFDANKTPGAAPRNVDAISPATLADGFEGLIRGIL
jgi:hypothetical protein